MAMRLVLLVLVAVQLTKVHAVAITSFVQSYWFVDYRYGFIRRGLGGQITGQADVAVQAAVYACALVPVVALLIVLELLVRRRTTSAGILALLIACSPLGIAELALYRRPDQFGLVLVVLVGIACVYLSRALIPVLAIAAIALAGMVFVHEGTLLLWGAAIPALIFATLDRPVHVRAWLAAATIVPAVLAAAFVVIFGAVDAETAATLREDAALNGPTVFAFLTERITGSIDYVLAVGADKHLAQLTVGSLIVFAHVMWVWRWVGTDWLGQLQSLSLGWRAGLAVATIAPVVVVFSTGIDWMRWFSVYTTAGLVVVAFALVAYQRATPQTTGPVELSWLQVAACLYFVSLTPVGEYEPEVPVLDLDILDRPRQL